MGPKWKSEALFLCNALIGIPVLLFHLCGHVAFLSLATYRIIQRPFPFQKLDTTLHEEGIYSDYQTINRIGHQRRFVVVADGTLLQKELGKHSY